jgi:FMN phosphatase YigB (HAD superfamily)
MTNKNSKQTLVFDWGDTVMQTFAEYSGVMADWPVVAEVPGISQALRELRGDYRFVIGTNAQGSNAAQIRQALDRVGIGHYFSEIFTFNELHARKPARQFFRGIEEKLGLKADQLIMIGDSYPIDALGAKQAGWRSIWYNPEATACAGHLPMNDLELRKMADLPALLKRTALPDLTTCLSWLQMNDVSASLLVHVQLVAVCAYQMALWSNQNGVSVDPLLAHRGGLLHDLAKLNADKSIDHGLAASIWLNDQGQSELAEIASRHMLFEILNESRKPITWEQKLVYLADKMVEKNAIVSIDERIAGLKTRYMIKDSLLNRAYPLISQLRDEVSTKIVIPPLDLPDRLKQALRNDKGSL